jgi:plastocyanin
VRLAAAASLALVIAATAAAPAQAADATVEVGDDFFSPQLVSINPGDSVTWDWSGSSAHNVKARAGQTERFRSRIQSGADKTFARSFRFPGRFRYFCQVHPDTMRAAVEVGQPETVDPRVRRLRVGSSGSTARVAFTLSERSLVTLSVRGARDRRVSRVLGAGRRSIAVRRLPRGSYSAAVTAKDGFGNRSRTARTSFSMS